MIELTADNALAYLRDRGWIAGEKADIEPLGGGVSNVVLRVVTDATSFVLKQSRPQLRTRDSWFSDLERIYREQAVMKSLGPVLLGAVPEVLYADRENYVFAMSCAPIEALSWKSELLAGQIDPAIGTRAGRVLALIHNISAQNADFRAGFSVLTVFEQLRIDPFYRRVQERRPEVAAAVGAVIEQMRTVKEALCHGDYTPKNFLVHDGRFTLVDYETAHFGDPTMDLGLFLAHILLKAARLPARRHDYLRLVRSFWRGYSENGTFRSAAELEQRGVQHLGVCLLARIDGTSPVEYLHDEPKRDAMRRLGCTILQWGMTRWEDAWSCAESEFAALEGQES
jgi:5-methylthioribose kinase